MGQAVSLTGMVLKVMPVNDYDKRITILTKECGKIVAFARGARRPNSQLLAATNAFAFGEFELFEGRSAYNLTKATIHNYFRDLTMDFDAVSIGFYFLEFAEYYCQEQNDEKEMLKLLYQSLRALESKSYNNRLVKLVFELKAMVINGEGPSVFSCIHCKKKENLNLFSVSRGGFFCRECATLVNGTPLLESTVYAIQYIVSSSIEKLYSFAVSKEVQAELENVVGDYMKHYVSHDFKSAKLLQEGSFLET